MDYTWDEAKYQTNLEKHGVRFEDAIPALSDDNALEESQMVDGQQRYKVIGMAYIGVLVVVIFEKSEEETVIISARPASTHEEKEYEKGI